MKSTIQKVLDMLKTKSGRMGLLNRIGILNFLSDEKWVKLMYKNKMGKELNLENPVTYNEKLQWMKINYYNPLYTQLVDKYVVRDYIADKIGEEYLIPLIGVYDKFDDIDFDKLPKQFVIKCNHDSGGVVICRDKSKFDINNARKKINRHLKINFYNLSREWPYKDIKPKIIIEKYMENENKNGLIDYKFFCFDGTPKFLYVSEGLEDHSTAKISFLSMDFQLESFRRKDFKPFNDISEVFKPINYDKMVELAKKLSANFPFVRVDIYEINGKLYFSEFTFFPCSGMLPFEPEEWDKIIGGWLKLPEK